MNNLSSISGNDSISFNQSGLPIVNKNSQNKQAKLVSLYSLQLISQQQQCNLHVHGQNQGEIKSPSQSSRKYIKFKGFLSDKKRSNKYNEGGPKTLYENQFFGTDESRIDFPDRNNFSFDVQGLDVQEDQKPKVKKIRTSQNFLKTEETTLQFKPKHTFMKVKTCLTPKNVKYSKFNSPHNVSLPQIENENEQRTMKHQQSSPNMLTIQNLQRNFQFPQKIVSNKSIVLENEKSVCQKCREYSIQKQNLCQNLEKVKSILKESKKIEENLRVFQELCLRSYYEELQSYEFSINNLIHNIEKNIITKQFHKNKQEKFITVFNETLTENNVEGKCQKIQMASFIDDVSNEIIKLLEEQALVKKSYKRQSNMGQFGKIKKNGQSKIQETQEMNASMDRKELCLEYNYQISKIYDKECDLSMVSIENVNDQILSNLENFKNQSSKWEESVPNLYTPKFELLTQSYDYKLQRQIDAFVESKSELGGFEQKYLDGSVKMLQQNVDGIRNGNKEYGMQQNEGQGENR